jgi:hypothetical protein
LIALVRALIAFFGDDLRGLAGPSGGFYAPATRGTCLQCLADALKIKKINVTVWPTACKHTPLNSKQRKAFKKWYLKNPDISAAADGTPAKEMTKAFALKNAVKCMKACRDAGTNESAWAAIQQKAYWREVDVWSELLSYWDRVVQNINDPAHEIFNMIKSLIGTIGNLGSQKLNASRRAFCRALKQTKKGMKPPWTNNAQNQVVTNCVLVFTNCVYV